MALSLLVALYLLLVIALPLALSAGVSYRTLPENTACPLCRAETLRLQSRWLDWASALLRRVMLQRRWCLSCGWEGVCKLPAATATRLQVPSPPPDAAGNGPSAPERPGLPTGEAVELRRIEVEGRAWRVLVECWCDAGLWYGRLLFMEPTGRRWADPARAFSGRSRRDVLDQAFALPDRLLACRLREAISD